MNRKSGTLKAAADKLVKRVRRKTRQTYSSEEKIRVVFAGLRGEESISALCRREGISESLSYSWPKAFLDAGKRRLSGELPPNFHPAGTGALWVDTPTGAGGTAAARGSPWHSGGGRMPPNPST